MSVERVSPGRVTCANTPFPCSVNLSSDDENCGACGVRCATDDGFRDRFHGRMRCVAGACELSCDGTYADCNGHVEDGCEVDLEKDDDKNCGVCGNVCEDFCYQLSCGCPAGTAVCDGTCVSINSDPMNCGECGNVCPPPTQAFPSRLNIIVEPCKRGECNVVSCSAIFADCDQDALNPDGSVNLDGNGCETRILSNPNNCGGCGIVCAPGEVCTLLQGCTCPCGAECDTSGRVLWDPNNCGACGHVCPGDVRSERDFGLDPARGKRVCNDGACGYTCTPNWGNCDGDIDNGCETNMASDPLNCGGCGVRCDGIEGQACVDGRCLTKDCEVIQ